jgi:hypothetical protein
VVLATACSASIEQKGMVYKLPPPFRSLVMTKNGCSQSSAHAFNPCCRFGITRAHLEEDAGKNVHGGADSLSGSSHTLVDYNSAGGGKVWGQGGGKVACNFV